jgi:hypothetical protein
MCTTRRKTHFSPAWARAVISHISASLSVVPRAFPLASLPSTHRGSSPMEFHAVFETLQFGRWYVHDATGLAPRTSLVRIATGRDAADAAFSAVNSGVAELEYLEVSAIVGSVLPWDDHLQIVELP